MTRKPVAEQAVFQLIPALTLAKVQRLAARSLAGDAGLYAFLYGLSGAELYMLGALAACGRQDREEPGLTPAQAKAAWDQRLDQLLREARLAPAGNAGERLALALCDDPDFAADLAAGLRLAGLEREVGREALRL